MKTIKNLGDKISQLESKKKQLADELEEHKKDTLEKKKIVLKFA